jgi:hypothetical protein
MPGMNKSLFAIALLIAGVLLSFSLSGCKSDPHETHISTPVATPRL